MPADDGVGLFGGDLGVEGDGAAVAGDFDHRGLVAHTDAADLFDDGGGACSPDGGFERLFHLVGSAGDAAGSAADADFGGVEFLGLVGLVLLGFVPGLLEFEEILDGFSSGVGGAVAVGNGVDLDNGREGAAAHAADAFDGELAGGVGGLVGVHFEVPSDGILDELGPFDMAGGSVADA